MSLPLEIVGATSGNGAEVDTNNNLQVNLPTNLTNPGFVNLAGQIPGTSGNTQNRPILVSSEGREHIALDRPVFYCSFATSATSANAIPIDVLKQTATTMTATAGSPNNGYLLLNASNITTVTTGIAYLTYGTFETYAAFGTRYEFEAMTVNAEQVGNVIELGCGLITSATSVGLLDGFCFRWSQSGTFIGVVSVGGTEYQTSPFTLPSNNMLHRFTCVVNQTGVEFYVDQILQGVLAAPAGAVGPTYQQNLPMLMRIYNNTAPTISVQIKIAEIWITQGGVDWQKPWSQIMSGMGQQANNVPFGQAMVAGGTSTNNQGGTAGGAAVPAAATGTNTAVLTGCATLGGIGTMTAQVTTTTAAGNMIFFQYPVPAQSATQGSKRLVITGLAISASNGGAVVATTPTTLLWSLFWGNTSVSLATNDAVTAKGPRFMTLGQMYVPTGAVIGQTYDRDIVRAFTTPIVVNPGEYVGVCVRFLIGTATASQTVVAAVAFEGYWE